MRVLPGFVLFSMALASMPIFDESTQAKSAQPPEWWGPTNPSEGFHIRIPVTVDVPSGITLSEPVVAAELEIAKLLADAGWPATQAAGSLQLRAFTLDVASVRVVAMRNFDPPVSGSINGRLIIYDEASSGLNVNVAPSVVVPGRLSTDIEPFHPELRPTITVLWRLQGSPPAGSQRHFYIYLDSSKNPGHDLTPPEGLEAGSSSAIHSAGPGQTLYGYAPPPGPYDGPPNVTVLGLYDGTVVDLDVEQGGDFAPSSTGSVVQINAYERRSILLPAGKEGTPFRLTSRNHPIQAFVAPEGFVPSLEGSYAGQRFLFVAGDETLYFTDAGTGAPTTINVQSLSDVGDAAGGALTFHLNDAENPYNFTVGAWASKEADAASCKPNSRRGDAPMVVPNQLYLATVTAGGPVMLQQGRTSALYQAPSLEGAPVGSRHSVVVADTPFRFRGAPCVMVARNADWYVAGAEAGTAQADANNPHGAFPLRTVPPAPDFAGPFVDGRTLANRPVAVAASTASWLWAGHRGDKDVPSSGGPSGGIGAREFGGFGQAVAFAPYPPTDIHVTARHVGGEASRIHTLDEAESLHVGNDPALGPLQSYRLIADRPVIVYPKAAAPGMLAGIPRTIAANVNGAAEFRGYLLDICPLPVPTPPAKCQSPVKSSLPGATVNYTFRIRNDGRGFGGALLTDVVDVSARVVQGEGWSAALDRATIAFGEGQTQDVTLTVRSPPDAAARSTASVVVTATSRGNPNVQVSEKATTYLKRSFGVGAWFDLVGGPKAQTRSVGPPGDAEFLLAVQNQGTVRDRFLLSLSAPERDWQTSLHDEDGREVEAIDLDAGPPGSVAFLRLRVRPPAAVPDAVLFTTLTTTSASQPGTFDRVTATTKVSAPSNLTATIHPSTVVAPPGEEAVFDLRLRNVGQGPAELTLSNRSDSFPNWSLPQTFIVDPASGSRVPVDRITVGPGETVSLGFGQPIPPGTRAGAASTYRIEGVSTGGAPLFELFPSVVTAAVHKMLLRNQAPTEMKPGVIRQPLYVTLENAGNVDEVLELRPGPVPAAWSLDVPQEWAVIVGENSTVPLAITVPSTVPAAAYNLSFVMTSQDGTTQTVNLTLSVPNHMAPEIDAPPRIEGQPGRAAVATVPVLNKANVPVRVRLVSTPDEGWSLTPFESLALTPGANGSVQVGWAVPKDAPDGPSPHSARLVFESAENAAPTIERVITMTIDVGRPVLRVSDITTQKTPGGRAVFFTITNVGTRPALGLDVELRAGSVVRDVAHLDVLAPGAEARLSVLDPIGAGNLQLAIDPKGEIPGAPETQKVLSIDEGHGGNVPTAPIAWLLVTTMVLAWILRRRATIQQRC